MTKSNSILCNSSVVIFGAANGWGKNICEVFRKTGNPTHIIEKNNSPEEGYLAIEKSDVIIIAVPDPDINNILLESYKLLKHGKSIVDCATNKSGFYNTLKELAVSGSSVCSTHPMVKPESSPRGQNVIIMPVGNNSDHASMTAKSIFNYMGINAELFDFDKHADAMIVLQMIPHVVQRILIDALGKGLDYRAMNIEDISRLAPANYLLAELGLGRVAIQRPDVSAGIVATALNTDFGNKILGGIQETLGKIISAGNERDKLAGLFQEGVTRLDEGGHWRSVMATKTEAALTRLGNLRSRYFVVDAPNKPGILKDILSVLITHNIDMTALDSQVIYDNEKSVFARFDIGITDENFDYEKVTSDLEKIGVVVTKSKTS